MVQKSITYYDLASEYYMGYPVNGLMQEARNRGFEFLVLKRPPELLQGLRLADQDRQSIHTLGVFAVRSEAEIRHFCIDSHDDSSVNGYFRAVLARVDAYFKLNCDLGNIRLDPELQAHEEKIHSLGCSFSLRPRQPWLFLPRLRPCKLYNWNWFSVKRRLRFLQRIPNLDWLYGLRGTKAKEDVFFVRRYYWEPGHAKSNELCCEIMDSLNKVPNIRGVVGFTNVPSDAPAKFVRHSLGRDRSYRMHVQQMARCRVCVYIPGTYNCLSFKFGQYLALGKAVVGLKLPFIPRPDLDSDAKAVLDEQFCCTEPREIGHRVRQLLADSRRRAELSAANVRIYETYFSPSAIARKILNTTELS